MNEAATLRRKRYVDTHSIRSAYPSPTTAGSQRRTASSVPNASGGSSSRHCRSIWKPPVNGTRITLRPPMPGCS